MNRVGRIASFFRQLSLFDPAPAAQTPQPEDEAAQAPMPAGASALSLSAAPARPWVDIGPVSAAEETAPSFQDLCRGPFAHIRVELNKRLWESWRVAWQRRDESLRLSVPAHVDEAPREVKTALLEWAVLVSRRNRRRDAALRARRAELETLIRDHLHGPVSGEGMTAGPVAGMRLARNHRKMERLRPDGAHHHLDGIFRMVNEKYFQGGLQARLTWSARLGGLSTHTVARDGEGNPYHLITISRGYDDPEVTPEILGGVVYHECLHIAIPPRRENGRRVVHGPDFRRREKEYEHYEVWRRWHRHGLPLALRRLRRSGTGRGGLRR